MEILIKTPNKVMNEKQPKTQKVDYWSEFGKGYLEVENMKKRALSKAYKKAYDELEDKESFNAQYLKTLID
ncbi:MAG: hypothetical protein EU541_01155 [Promethearchaeota archaeon]|nr:MAG: hypothetical protein EU541_01155 [Candidatus Lokiarchaeota archaeon]